MNRLIILDNIRHGLLRLFIVGSVYFFVLIPITNFLWSEANHAFGAFFLGIMSIILCNTLRPNNAPLAATIRLETLLPIPQTELINTQWLMRVIFPAALLAILCAIAGLLGITGQILPAGSELLPVHLFFAFLCGMSLIFLAGATSNQPFQSPIYYLLGILIPMGYFLALSSLQEVLGSPFAPMILASLLVAVLYRTAYVRLASDLAFRSIQQARSSRRLRFDELLPEGFWRLSNNSFAYSFKYWVVGVLPYLMLFSWWLTPGTFEGASEVFSSYLLWFLPNLCFMMYIHLLSNDSPLSQIRILRVLPLTVGVLSLHILTITVGTQMLALAILSAAAVALNGIGSGLLFLDACLVSMAILSPIVPLAMRLQGSARTAAAIAYFSGSLFASVYLFISAFDEESTPALLLINLIALAALLASWWLVKRILTHSSAPYKVELNQPQTDGLTKGWS